MQREDTRRSYHDIPIDLQLMDSEKRSSKSSPINNLQQKVEMSSVSTTSLPMSFPQYMIDDINTFHTDNMDSSSSTQTGGTSCSPRTKKRRSKDPRGGNGNDNTSYNQVSKRFSHFVVDQQNPYLAQRLDNLSFESGSFGSVSPNKQTPGHQSSVTRSKSSKSSFPLTQEISNSMESQATIFSTRPDKNEELKKRRSGKRKASLLSYGTLKSASLSRSKAIRFKSGSIMYRIHIRMKKLMSKLKRLRFTFSASSKRSSILKRGSTIRRQRTKKLHRKDWRSIRKEQKQRHGANISAPSTNPEVGYGRVDRIRGLDDEVKYYAGAPKENVNLPEVFNDIKRDQISGYLGEQQKAFLNNLWSKSSISSINYPKSIFDANSSYKRMIGTAITDEIDESNSNPPLPPPHYGVTSATKNYYDNLEIMSLWKSYLSSVLSKRIELRQEINLFQSLLASGRFNNLDPSNYRLSISSSQYSSLESRRIQQHETTSESPTSHYSVTTSSAPTSSETGFNSGSSDIFIDPPTEEFNKRYLNRRSILGEMLDYSSETDLSSNSSSTSYKGTSSEEFKASPDIEIERTYGISRNGSKISTRVV